MEPLTQLYEQSYRHFRAVASRYVGEDAEDVVQDAFVQALRHAHRFRYEAAYATWLHRIVVNACVSHLRKHRRRERLRGLHLDHNRTVRPAGSAAVTIRTALGFLRPSEHRILVMYEVMGYTHREIAERLSIPEGTSKGRLTTARRKLNVVLRGTR